jgi:hypothetical protein
MPKAAADATMVNVQRNGPFRDAAAVDDMPARRQIGGCP